MTAGSEVPNPGSNAARDLGCICPVMDNNRGLYLPWQGGWLILEGCPLHDPCGDPTEEMPTP